MESLTLKPIKRLTVVNSGWAFLLGLATVAFYIIQWQADCPACHAFVYRWHDTAMVTGISISLMLTAMIGGWIWHSFRQQRALLSAVAVTGTILLVDLALNMLLTNSTSNSLFAAGGHTMLMLLYTAGTFLVATLAYLPAQPQSQPLPWQTPERLYFRTLLATMGTTFLLLMSGVAVRVTDAVVVCQNWPLCGGGLWPSSMAGLLNLLHRGSTLFVGVLIAAIVLQTLRNYRQERNFVIWAVGLGGLYLNQILVGGLYSWAETPVITNLLHLALSLAIWGSLVVLTTSFYLKSGFVAREVPMVKPQLLAWRQKAWVYFKLTKPFILILLLVTTIGAMFIAARGLPSLFLLLMTTMGGILSAGGASVLNSYIDSDIDHKMSRTSRRATVTGLVSPTETLIFGLSLSTLSVLVLLLFVNPVSAALSTLGILYYVFFYTLYLKRNTIHNIIIGGAAGALPPLVGWTAVTGELSLEAFYLFAIIFFWTPPHTWAMALLVEKDYANAQVPMLPVVAGTQETTYQTFLYSVLLICVTLLPFSFGMVGWLYMVVALLLGAQFLRLAWLLWQHYTKATSKRLYKYSQSYLALLFLAMAIDRMLLG